MTPIARPDTHTQFHIDRSWFEKNGRNLREEMHAVLCDECRARYPSSTEMIIIDRVNPLTGEVARVEALWECLADHCGRLPSYIAPSTPLTAAIFRAFLANGNQPMTPEELYKRIHKSSAAGILRLLMGTEVENGIVPFDKGV